MSFNDVVAALKERKNNAHTVPSQPSMQSCPYSWLARSTGEDPGSAEEQHVVQLLGVDRPDSSPVRCGELPSEAPGRAGSAAAAGAPSRCASRLAAHGGAEAGRLERGGVVGQRRRERPSRRARDGLRLAQSVLHVRTNLVESKATM